MDKIAFASVTLLLVLIAACSAPRARKPKHETVLVRTSRLIDGVADAPATDVDLIIVDGRIARMGQLGRDLQEPAGARVIDLRGYTVLPGLIDMHVHLTDSPEAYADLKAFARESVDEVMAGARAHAAATLRAGFTTVRDVGTYQAGLNLKLRDEIAAGKTPGPRVFAAPFYLTIPDGGGDLAPEGWDPRNPGVFRRGVARSPDGFRMKAALAVRDGADLLKVIASGAVLAEHGTPGAPEMTRDELAAVVGVAHAAGLKVAAHAHGARSIRDAILAGVDTVEHASLVDGEGLRLAKEHGVAFSMDVYDGDFIGEEGRKKGWLKTFVAKNDEVTEKQRRSFTRALKAGVPIVFGTDAGVYPHGNNARQFHVMVERGMTPMQAIRAATSVAARFLGKERDVGELSPGHYADLIAVEGDPLEDITRLENVKAVLKSGRP